MLDRPSLQRLFRYGFSLTNNEDAAYDLLQAAMEVYLRKPPRDNDSALQYIQRIMRNRYIDQYRRDQNHPTVHLDDADDNQPVHIDSRVLEDIVIAEVEVETILAGLEPIERELLFLWAVEGYTAQEIAEKSDSPRGTVLSRIHRLRKKIIRHQASTQADMRGGAA